MIAFQCPACLQDFTVKDEFAGRATKCRKCGASLRVPAALGPALNEPTPVAPVPVPRPSPAVRPPTPLAEAMPVLLLLDPVPAGAMPVLLPEDDNQGENVRRSKKGLILGLSIGGGVLLIGLIVLVVVLTTGSSSHARNLVGVWQLTKGDKANIS
jgi:hypothetical protein